MTIQRTSRREKKEELLRFIKERKTLRKKTKPTLVKTGRKPFAFLAKFRKIQVPRRLVAKIKRTARKVSQLKKRVVTPETSAEIPKANLLSRQEKKEKLLRFLETKREGMKAVSREREEARKTVLAKKAIPFSRQEKKEKLLQFIREKKSLREKKFKPTFAKKTGKFPFLSLVKIKKVTGAAVIGMKKVIAPTPKAPSVEKPEKAGRVKKAVRSLPRKDVKKKPAVPKIDLKVLLRKYGLRIFFFLLLLAWIGEVYIFYSKIYFKKPEFEEVAISEEKKSPEKKGEIKVVMRTQDPGFIEIEIDGERDPFSSELFRTGLLVRPPKFTGPIRPMIKPKEPTEKLIVIPPLIPEGEKLSALASVGKPRVPEIFPPKVTCPLRYRGSLEIMGIEYLFVEGKKPHQALIGDTIEGYHLFNKLGDTIYLSREGNIFQLQREILLCPLHYRGRLIMDGKEYLFLEGKRMYRVTLGGTAEGYQVIRRIGNILYLLKDNNIFELKEE